MTRYSSPESERWGMAYPKESVGETARIEAQQLQIGMHVVGAELYSHLDGEVMMVDVDPTISAHRPQVRVTLDTGPVVGFTLTEIVEVLAQ